MSRSAGTRRVVISGLGFISSIGNDAVEVTRRLRDLRHGLAPHAFMPGLDLPVTVAGTIKGFATQSTHHAEWRWPERYTFTRDMLRSLAVPTGLALVAMLVFFGLVRPALKATLVPLPAPASAAAPAPGSKLTAVVDDEQTLPALPAPRSSQHLAGARALALENPAAVASIVRDWVNGEAAPVKAGSASA